MMHQNCETVELLMKELKQSRSEVTKMILKLQEVKRLIDSLDASYTSIFNIISENIENGTLSVEHTLEVTDITKSWN